MQLQARADQTVTSARQSGCRPYPPARRCGPKYGSPYGDRRPAHVHGRARPPETLRCHRLKGRKPFRAFRAVLFQGDLVGFPLVFRVVLGAPVLTQAIVEPLPSIHHGRGEGTSIERYRGPHVVHSLAHLGVIGVLVEAMSIIRTVVRPANSATGSWLR